MAVSNITKKYRKLSFLFGLLSFCALVGPIAYYAIEAFVGGSLAIEKVALAGSVLVVLIMTAVAAVNKIAMKSRIWILLFALFLCLDNFLVPLIVIGSCQIADELILTPLHKHFKTKASINTEIDKRSV